MYSRFLEKNKTNSTIYLKKLKNKIKFIIKNHFMICFIFILQIENNELY